MKTGFLRRIGLTVLVSLLITVFLSTSTSTYAIDSADDLNSQNEALSAYDVLMSSEGFSVASEGNDKYPDDFGGYFIGADDLLHVQVLDTAVQKYSHVFDDDAAVIIEAVDYSYNQLLEIIGSIRDSYDSIIESYVNVYENTAYVGVAENSVLRKLDHSKIINSLKLDSTSNMDLLTGDLSYLDFPLEVYVADEVQSSSELWGGDAISTKNGGYTLGATGYYQGSPAIVTAGHGMSLGTVLNYNGTRIGSVAFHRFLDNGYGDYSIVTLSNTTHSIVNKAFGPAENASNPIRVTGSVDKAINGQRIYRYGRNSKWTYGTVIDTDIDITYDGATIRGLTRASFSESVIPGDSGGPIYIYQNGYKVCGILDAYSTLTPTTGYYTPFLLIADKGFSVLTN